ncbi:MAG: hypothetical protein EXS32_00590 [Opitutus sp.]|nr:hypothetical protein [Opitutus sp.]
MTLRSTLSLLRRQPIALAIGLALAPSLSAQAPTPPVKSYSVAQKTGEEFQKLGPLQSAKPPDMDGMMRIIDALLPTLPAGSYDLALTLDMQARLNAGKELWGKSVDAWETALRLSDANTPPYFDKNKTLEILLFLAQMSYQQVIGTKVPAVQQQYLAKASGYFKRWLATTPKPNPDIQFAYAQIIYGQAVVDPAHINRDLLAQARLEVEKGLRASIHPKEMFYMLLSAIQQQEGDNVHAAETLELLVKGFPQKKDYWPQLWATYLNLSSAAAAKPGQETASRENLIRAINAQERAQALGFMKAPKDNLNLVSLYLNAGQLTKGNIILYAGLKDGSIESTPANWLSLGYNYLQTNQELRSIAVYQEAAALYPASGQFDLQIADIYYRAMEKTKEAYPYYKSAVRKGGLEKDRQHLAHMMLANAAYELEDLQEAMSAIKTAASFPNSDKEPYIERLKGYIETALADREANQKAKEAKANPAATAPKKI